MATLPLLSGFRACRGGRPTPFPPRGATQARAGARSLFLFLGRMVRIFLARIATLSLDLSFTFTLTKARTFGVMLTLCTWPECNIELSFHFVFVLQYFDVILICFTILIL